MPTSSMKPCAYPGCQNLVKHGRCEQHRQTIYDYHDPESQALYNTQRWKRIRKAQLAQYPWCADHLERGEYVPATDVDHITPHRGDKIKFFVGPFASLCHACHSRKTAGEVWGVGGAKKVFGEGVTSGLALVARKTPRSKFEI